MLGSMDRPLRELLGLVRAAIAAESFADGSRTTMYKALDRMDQEVHLGTFVWSPASSDNGKVAGRRSAQIYDTVEIILLSSLPRTPGQIETMDRHTEHEDRIVEAVSSYPELQPYEPLYRDVRRLVTTDRAWIRSTITMRLQRMQRTRRGA